MITSRAMTAEQVSTGAAPGGAPPTDRPPSEGDVLDGRYRLVALLGRGGFGDVWRADELLPDGTPFRQVALKLLAPHVTDAASWVEEAKLLASFRHPSLVTIFATGVFHGAWPQPFVAMELLEGDNLADVLSEHGPVPWRRALAWAREAAAALDVIHERGVVHLDLKPANLFLCKDGTLKVLDFGIARRSTAPAPKPRYGEPAPAPRAAPAPTFAPTGAAPPSSLPRSVAPLSQREAEMATAAFVAEHPIDVKEAPAASAGQQATPEAFAPTFALAATSDALAKTHHAGGTTARAIIGTPGYMAPEIFEQAEPSAATDAYALAVCVAVLTTGRLPLDVPDEPEGGWSDATAITAWWAAIRAATLRGQMRDLRAGGARLPAGLARLLRRLFSVDAAARGVAPGTLRALLDEVWERPHGLPEAPFAGAAPLGAEHEGHLFGRDEEIARLGRDLAHEPCVVLVGPDACGKTSLALAGLAPHLGKGATDGKDDFRAVVLRDPGRGDAALDEALAAVSPDLEGATVDALVVFCQRARVGLVIVVDPLEAVARASVEDRARLGELLSLAGDGHARPGLRVIAVLGEEHVAAVQAAAFGPALRASLRYVGPPPPQAAGAIVRAPLRLAGAEASGIEPVVAEVQREIAAPGRLPFVAQALADLWAARDRSKDRPAVSGKKWKEMRGVVGAVARAADRALDAMSGADRALADEMLLFFTATDGTTVRWTREDLFDAFGQDRAAAERVVEGLVAAGVVRAQGRALALAHEGLLEGWRRLQAFRHAHLVRLAFVERLRESTQAWEKSAKSREMLLRGALLADVAGRPEWMAHGLVPRERDLVAESLRAERRRRLGRAAGAVAGALAVVLLLLGKRAIDRQQEESKRAEQAAVEQARLFELVAHARRTDDPFLRAALMAEAIHRGSEDGLLPVELADAVADIPKARFLTLDPVVAPTFDWEDRWVIAGQTSSALLIADLRPPEPDVIEDLPLDADPDKVHRKTFLTPKVHLLRPHAEPIAERVPFAFDTTFATRSAQGEVRLFRLTEDGQVALAAIPPLRCAGPMRTAARAPVLACSGEEGLAVWDARLPPDQAVKRSPWKGTVADLSPDGSVVVAMAERTLFLWKTGGGRTLEIGLNEPLLLARVSPRDRAVAAVTTSAVEVYGLDEAADPLVRVEHYQAHIHPISARWDAGGLDLGLCGRDGRAMWVYLRGGGRLDSEPAPAGSPCGAAPGKHVPVRATRTEDLGEFGELVLGSRPAWGGYRLPDGRLLTRDLVLFDEPKRAARSLLWFRGRATSGAEDEAPPGGAVARVVRDGDEIVWQVGGEIRAYEAATGKRLLSQAGNLLRSCDDRRLAAWTKTDRGYRVFDARTNSTLGEIPREPMLVLGIDAKCTTLYTQALDGVISARPLGAGEPPRAIATADGYVYDVRESAARGADGKGLYLLVSSGAIARLDEATHGVRLLTYATPRATAVADGLLPGEVLFSDATGVLVLRATGAIDRVAETDAEVTITDVAAAPDKRAVLFLAGKKLHVLDVTRGERRAMAVKTHERMLRWDDEGSVLLWSSDRAGPAEGAIVPRARALAMRVAAATSNLAVTEEGTIVLER